MSTTTMAIRITAAITQERCGPGRHVEGGPGWGAGPAGASLIPDPPQPTVGVARRRRMQAIRRKVPRSERRSRPTRIRRYRRERWLLALTPGQAVILLGSFAGQDRQ